MIINILPELSPLKQLSEKQQQPRADLLGRIISIKTAILAYQTPD